MAGDFDTARQRQQASLALLQGDNDPEMTAYTTMALGMTMLHLDRIEEALAWERQSLAAFQALGDAWGTAFIMGQMGQVYQRLGDPTTAEEVMAEALERGHQLGDPFLLAIFYSNASFIAQAEGDLDRATELARTAGDFQRSTGHVHSLGLTLTMLGKFAQQQGDEATARGYWEEALEIFTDIGNGRFAAEAEQLLAGS
ncbi:MAG: tetratricopeptide repeat protein [Chloroflexota bacterium]